MERALTSYVVSPFKLLPIFFVANLTLIGGMYFHVFMFCPIDFFSNHEFNLKNNLSGRTMMNI